MTIIRPNSIAGITSLTAVGNDIAFYNSEGTANAVLGVNVYTTSGISTFTSLTFKNYTETVYAYGNTGASPSLALSNGTVVTATLDDNATFTFDLTGCPSVGNFGFTLILTNDATPSRTITWPASVKWPNGSVPVRTETANKIDVYTFFTYDNGTTWWGNLALYNFS
jgi:hypothetical protein